MTTIGSLFSGIGGLEHGLECAGLGPVIWQAESDKFCREVLAKHWPDVKRYEDVRDIDANTERPTILCGGFPCQDVSNAGARAGLAGERSGLWYEFARIIRELRPRVVVVENVPGLLVRGMGDVLGDLAACGYDAEWDCVPAVAVGAPHIRDRVFIIAWATSGGVPDAERDELRERWQRHGQQHEEQGSPEPRHDGAHGHVADAEGSRWHASRSDRREDVETSSQKRQIKARGDRSQEDVADADVPRRSEQRSAESDAQKLAAPERGSEGGGGEDYAAEYRRRFVTPFVADAEDGEPSESQGDGGDEAVVGSGARTGGGAIGGSVAAGVQGRERAQLDGTQVLADADLTPRAGGPVQGGQRDVEEQLARDRGSDPRTGTRPVADADGGRFEGERLEKQAGQQGPRGRVAHRCGDDRLFGEWPRRSSNWETEPDVGRVADGVPRRVDRLRSLGNAVVPQVAEHIGHLVVRLLECQR